MNAGEALPRLMLVADAPTLGSSEVVALCAAALSRLPVRSAVVVDRDGVSSDGVRLRRLGRLRDLTRAAEALLVVSARPDLAVLAGADGVQLGERGLCAAAVRAAFPGLRVGRSCHDRSGIAKAARLADWVWLSPVRAPFSKAATGAPLGVEGFRAAAAGAGVPVFGLGGVDAELALRLMNAGAHGVACIGAVFQSPDPAEAAAGLWAATQGRLRDGAI